MKKLYDKITYQYNKKKQIYVVQFTIREALEKTRFLNDLFWHSKPNEALYGDRIKGVDCSLLKI